MDWFFHLPEGVVKDILTEWCDTKSAVMLDSAMCVHGQRQALLTLFHNCSLRHVHCGAHIDATLDEVFAWLLVRGLRIRKLTIDSSLSAIPPAITQQLSADILARIVSVKYIAGQEGHLLLLSIIPHLSSLRHLTLYDLPLTDSSSAILEAIAEHLSMLTRLHILRKQRLFGDPLNLISALQALTSLERFSLSHHSFERSEAAHLPKCLQVLTLDYIPYLREEALLTAITHCPQLRILSVVEKGALSHHKPLATNTVMETIATHLPQLEQLILCVTGVRSNWTTIEPVTQACRQLCKLSVSPCRLLTPPQLWSILQLPFLQSLYLGSNKHITLTDCRMLVAPSIKTLFFSDFKVLKDGDLLALPTMFPSLETLYFTYCWSITAPGVAEMLAQLPHLRKLTINNGAISFKQEHVREAVVQRGIKVDLSIIEVIN